MQTRSFDWFRRTLQASLLIALLLPVSDLSEANAQTAAERSPEQTSAEKPERSFQVLEQTVVKRGDHSVTFQRVAPPPAAPSTPTLVPAPRVLSPDERAAQERREAKLHAVLFFSATVLDHRITELRWSDEGKDYRAFSSIDFRYFSGMGEIETAEAIYTLMLALESGTAEVLAERTREFPQVALLPKDRAAWVPADGSGPTNTTGMTALDAVHPYYDAHREALIQAYGEREAARAEAERQLSEHPPVRKDTVITYWRRTAPAAPPQKEGVPK